MMLVRAITLSLALLLGIGSVIPFIFHDTAEAKPRYKNKKHKKIRKYSKAWWRWYHRQQRKKRAILARKRALRAKQILAARQRLNPNKAANETVPAKIGKNAPDSNQVQFRVNDNNGNSLGIVRLAIVGQATGEDSEKKIGGVLTSSLRRGVVDEMVRENGWVVNDYHKTVNGKMVYLVVAQSSLNGVVQSRTFYFTQIDGKIYRITSTSPTESHEKIGQESEKMIKSLQQGNNVVGIK